MNRRFLSWAAIFAAFSSLLLLAAPDVARAAITAVNYIGDGLGNAGTVGGTPWEFATPTGGSISHSFTVTGGDVLVVELSDRQTTYNVALPTSLTWDGLTLTEAVTSVSSAGAYRVDAIYYYDNAAGTLPTLTSSITASFPDDTAHSGDVAEAWMSAFTLSGVNTTVTPATLSAAATGTLAESVGLNNVVAGSYAAVNYIFGDNGYTTSIAASSGATSSGTATLWHDNAISSSSVDQGYLAGLLTGSNTFTATAAGTGAGTPYKTPLVVAVFTPITNSLIWTGSAGSGGNANWNTTDANWSGTSTQYSDGASVTFTDSGINTNITIAAAVQPAGLAFSNSSTPYTFGGAAIAGTASVTLTGGGLVTFNNANTYSGPTTISAGTLQIGGTGSLGSGGNYGATITNNALLAVNTSSPQTFSGVISGSGTLYQGGSGVTTLTAANTYTGPTNISGGTLQLGTGTGGQDGSLATSGITNNGALTYNLNGNQTVNYSISGSGGLAKLGGGMLTLAATQSYSGATTVSAGTLQLSPGSIGIKFATGSSGTYPVTGQAGVVPMSNWNNLTGTSGTAQSLLTNSNTPTNATVTWGSWPATGQSFSGSQTDQNAQLLNAYVSSAYQNSAGTISISGIPYGKYTVYGYVASSANGTQAQLIVNGSSKLYMSTSSDITTTPFPFIQATNTTGSSFPPANYGMYSGLTSPSLTVQTYTVYNVYAGVAAVEIVPTSGLNVLPTSTTLAVANGATVDLGGVSQQVAALSDATPGGGGPAAGITNSGSAVTLTLAPTVTATTTFSGAIQDGSGKVALTMSGPGTQVLAGANTYSGATTINGGVLSVGASNTLSPNSALTVSGGTLDATGFAQAVKSLMMGPGGALNLYVGNLLTAGSGAADFAGTLNISNLAGATSSGTTELMAYGSRSGSFGTINGLTSGFTLVYAPTQLDIVQTAGATATTYTLGVTAAPQAIHVSTAGNQASATISTSITNTGTGLQDTLDYSGLQASALGGSLSAATGGNGSALAQGNSGTATQTFQSATAGSFSLMPLVTSATNTNAGGNATLSGSSGATLNVYNLAAGTVSSSVNLGSIHAGGTFGTQALTIANTAPAGAYSEGLDAAFDPASISGAATASGSIANLSAGTSDSASMVVGLGTAAQNSPGPVTGAVNVNFLSDGATTSLLGTSPPASGGTQTITVTGSVYSGKAQWSATGSGNWSTDNNWSDTQGNGTAGAPGVLGFAGDTATFGNAIGSNSATITLDTPATVAALTFDNSAAGYTLGGSNTLTLNNSGVGATITVANGSHAISAPMEISGGSLAIVVSNSGALSISGNISDDNGQEPLTLAGDGSGQLILSGSNSYGGGMSVEAGTLIVNNAAALPDGSSLAVGSGGTFIFDPSVTGAPQAVAPAGEVAAVPEPGTVAMLLAVLWSAAIYRRFRRPKAFGERPGEE